MTTLPLRAKMKHSSSSSSDRLELPSSTDSSSWSEHELSIDVGLGDSIDMCSLRVVSLLPIYT